MTATDPKLHAQSAALQAEIASATAQAQLINQQFAQISQQATEINIHRVNAQSAINEVQSIAAQMRNVNSEVAALKSFVSDTQAVVAQKSQHIEQAQHHADTVRSNLDRQLTAGIQQVSEIDALRSKGDAYISASAAELSEVKTARANIDSEREEISRILADARESLESIKTLSERSMAIEEKIAIYEGELTRIKEESASQLLVIESLLPGATSAGLASEFDKRRKSFLKPSGLWQVVFVISLFVLVLLASSGLAQVYLHENSISYDEIMRLWLARLPVAGALIWLALYASREANLAKRLEEDYGYKSAVAASFLGFHKQMSEITNGKDLSSPVSRLCADTLATIATPPGRIYGEVNHSTTPMSEFIESLKKVISTNSASEKK